MSIFEFCIKDLSPLGISYKKIENGHTEDFHFIGGSNNPRLLPDEQGFHHHTHYELIYVLQGELTQHFVTGSIVYQKGDACLMNLDVLHREGAETDCEVLFLNMLPEFLDEYYRIARFLQEEATLRSPVYQFLSNRDETGAQRQDFIGTHELRKMEVYTAEQILTRIRKELEEKREGYSFRIYGALSDLILELENQEHYYHFSTQMNSMPEQLIFSRLLRVLENAHSRISRAELGAMFNYSPDHLNRITKKYCGMSLLQLEQKYLVEYLCRQLRETDRKISDLIEEAGYKNRYFFYKIFEEETGTTPLKYRKSHKKKAYGP